MATRLLTSPGDSLIRIRNSSRCQCSLQLPLIFFPVRGPEISWKHVKIFHQKEITKTTPLDLGGQYYLSKQADCFSMWSKAQPKTAISPKVGGIFVFYLILCSQNESTNGLGPGGLGLLGGFGCFCWDPRKCIRIGILSGYPDFSIPNHRAPKPWVENGHRISIDFHLIFGKVSTSSSLCFSWISWPPREGPNKEKKRGMVED